VAQDGLLLILELCPPSGNLSLMAVPFFTLHVIQHIDIGKLVADLYLHCIQLNLLSPVPSTHRAKTQDRPEPQLMNPVCDFLLDTHPGYGW